MCLRKICKGSSFPVRQSDFLKVAILLLIFCFQITFLVTSLLYSSFFSSAISPTSYYLFSHTHLYLFINSHIHNHLHTHNHPLTPIHASQSYSSKYTSLICIHVPHLIIHTDSHAHVHLSVPHTHLFLYPYTHIYSLIFMYSPHSFTHTHLHTHIHTFSVIYTCRLIHISTHNTGLPIYLYWSSHMDQLYPSTYLHSCIFSPMHTLINLYPSAHIALHPHLLIGIHTLRPLLHKLSHTPYTHLSFLPQTKSPQFF